MVFGIDDLLIMGLAVAAKAGYERYERKKRASRLSSLPSRPRSISPARASKTSLSSIPSVSSSPLSSSVSLDAVATTREEVYESCPISGTETRILNLKSNEDGIVLELLRIDLDDDPPDYVALSYAWDNAQSQGVRIKNSSFTVDKVNWEVSETVYQAFLALKSHFEEDDLLVWVDQICIDQENEDEQQKQVPLMKQVYGKATGVVLWLGAATPESDHILDHLKCCDERGLSTAQSLKTYGPGSVKCCAHCHPAMDLGLGLLDRRWWRRTWVIQEIMLNADVMVLCGNRTIMLDQLLTVANFATTNNLPTLPLPHERATRYMKVNTDNFRLPISVLREFRERVCNKEDIDFTEWIEVFHKQDTTYSRDKLYGLYGLADHNKYCDFPITYTKTTNVDGEVVFEIPDSAVLGAATKAIITASGKLDFICLGGRDGHDSSFASWAPDLTSRPHHAYSYWPLNYMSMPAFKSSSRKADCDWQGSFLLAKGYEIDVVGNVGLVDRYHDDMDQGRYDPEREDVFRAYATEMVLGMGASQQQFAALAKTIVCDMDEGGTRLSPGEDGFSVPRLQGKSAHFNPTARVADPSASEAVSYSSIWQEKAKHRWTDGRCFFTTQKGRLCIGPANTKEDDVVCVLHGASVPFVLRREYYPIAGKVMTLYQFLGESYVHGMMDGEVNDLGLEETTFTIT